VDALFVATQLMLTAEAIGVERALCAKKLAVREALDRGATSSWLVRRGGRKHKVELRSDEVGWWCDRDPLRDDGVRIHNRICNR